MAIEIKLDLMLVKRKMSLTELSERIGISLTNLSLFKKGKVTKEADYCMLLRFSRVAGGNVFREQRKERVKQFFYHKLVYGKENEGMHHCVGCGRCITECMAKIDITKETARVREEYEKTEK